MTHRDLQDGSLSALKQLNQLQKLRDSATGAAPSADNVGVQLPFRSKEEDPPEQQEGSPCLDQEDPPQLPHIKEEQEELWTSQEGEQFQGLEEADTKFTYTLVPVKSEEDDEENPQSSQFHQSQTEENRDAQHLKTEVNEENCGGSEPAKNFYPESHLQPDTDDKMSHSSDPETDDSSCEWDETWEPQSGGKTSFSSSEGSKNFGHKGHLQKHSGIQTGGKSFSCSVCGKTYPRKNSLRDHMILHTEGKGFTCSVCKKTFPWRGHLELHMRTHTGEKPFICSFCGEGFARKSTLTFHLRVHTGEKPYTCSVCKASFSLRHNLVTHMRMHTGEKPFSCSFCGKEFGISGNLRRHLTVHTGEKPFSCVVCGKTFVQKGHLSRHLSVHTGEKPFSCNVCDKRFTQLSHVKRHKCTGESSGSK